MTPIWSRANPQLRDLAVYESGGWRFFWNDPDAMTKALDRCAKEGKPCWLYAVDDRVGVHDLQATILHLLGLNHEKLTFRFQGRDYRLTDVHGEVVSGLLA